MGASEVDALRFLDFCVYVMEIDEYWAREKARMESLGE
jgi:hypothetical protein